MEGLHCDVGAMQTTLQETPEILHSVGVNAAIHVLFHVVYKCVSVFLGHAAIEGRFVRIDFRAVLNVIQNLSLKVSRLIFGTTAALTLRCSLSKTPNTAALPISRVSPCRQEFRASRSA